MGDLPKKMQYPVVDFLVMGQLAQSLSQYAVNCAAEDEASNIPCESVPIRYLNSLLAACIWTVVGECMN